MPGSGSILGENMSTVRNDWASSGGGWPGVLDGNLAAYAYTWLNGWQNIMGFTIPMATGDGVSSLQVVTDENNDGSVLWELIWGDGTLVKHDNGQDVAATRNGVGSGAILAWTPGGPVSAARIAAKGGLRVRWTNTGSSGTDVGGPFARTGMMRVDWVSALAPRAQQILPLG